MTDRMQRSVRRRQRGQHAVTMSEDAAALVAKIMAALRDTPLTSPPPDPGWSPPPDPGWSPPPDPGWFCVTRHALERYRERGHPYATKDDVLGALGRGTFADRWHGRPSKQDAWIIVADGAFPVKEAIDGAPQLVATTFFPNHWAGG